ncbi:probable Phospholipase/Carboxylesterase family protein [Marinomonas sp. MED121]|uniref:alpha/beta hydrolase n=1 Tax=Marinomonas sp. MED121 TaxID=314277 RepID=UPI00006909BF|nr:dienelactone hydrolase family protein [Marinomonas sp. MED121]EAQ63185.1 probable Phospholipase/Carboxylesterase family protein [Marinomonas sp. MED121]
MSQALEYLTLETSSQADSAVIWLHGLGADGNDFKAIVPSLNLPQNAAIRFIFPHAPVRPVTINGGMPMRAWYDILEMSLERKVDMANIDESVEQITHIIEQQIEAGIAIDRILIAGFSQGGVIAYQVGLLGKYKLAGIMALSTYLADASLIPAAKGSINENTPVLIHHGTQDPVVPYELATRAQSELEAKGYQVEVASYPMPHSVCPEQVVDISRWLQRSLDIH